MAEEYVILVDKNDKQIGLEEKVKCHLPEGKLHRAFTALIFDRDGNLLLTRRAKEKMLWPGDWDGTVASHPRESETYVSAGERRIPEELGTSCKMDYMMKFEYHVPYKDVGSENEICGTLIGTLDNDAKPNPAIDEIDETRWISPAELAVELKSNPEKYCPWMLVALELLDKSEKETVKKHSRVLTAWMSEEIKSRLPDAIRVHLPDDKWRIVP